YGHIVVHVFLTQYREFYRLEDLWADAPKKVYKERRKPAAKKDAEAED
ncbi:MAG: RsfS/YbeB/iojap family protein, partial [Bacteroidales bacterium]|nr:RsfS/YbeB/iojap family protein [Bacteroidales bacterium]